MRRCRVEICPARGGIATFTERRYPERKRKGGCRRRNPGEGARWYDPRIGIREALRAGLSISGLDERKFRGNDGRLVKKKGRFQEPPLVQEWESVPLFPLVVLLSADRARSHSRQVAFDLDRLHVPCQHRACFARYWNQDRISDKNRMPPRAGSKGSRQELSLP